MLNLGRSACFAQAFFRRAKRSKFCPACGWMSSLPRSYAARQSWQKIKSQPSRQGRRKPPSRPRQGFAPRRVMTPLPGGAGARVPRPPARPCFVLRCHRRGPPAPPPALGSAGPGHDMFPTPCRRAGRRLGGMLPLGTAHPPPGEAPRARPRSAAHCCARRRVRTGSDPQNGACWRARLKPLSEETHAGKGGRLRRLCC